VIPARGGSKGITRKNLSRINGITLIAHACSVALRCPSVSIVVVSSDDDDMCQEGSAAGAHLSISRPSELATDESPAVETWRHAWISAEDAFETRFEVSVFLQPTSPTRTVADVEATLELLIRTGSRAAITVSPVPKHFAPQKTVNLTSFGEVSPAVAGSIPNARRQDIEPTYWLNGHCYAARRESIVSDGVVIPNETVALVIDRPIANIDEPADLELARRLMTPATPSPSTSL
jgi:CMP-N,N'-diacetyllegionaminic acid synthase